MKNKKECTNCNNHSIKEYYGDGHCPECGRKVPPNPFMKNKKEKKHEHNFIWNNRKHPKCKCGYSQSPKLTKKVRIEKKKLVIAGDYGQYKLWYETHKRLKGFEDCRYINEIEKLYGYQPNKVEIVLVGKYWKNPAYNSPRYQYLGGDLVVIKPITSLSKEE